MVYGITSLAPQHGSPQRFRQDMRAEWDSATNRHWVRDVTFDEDRSQVRSDALPAVMAALRNTAIGLLRCAGARTIVAACRHDAAQPRDALALLGIQPEN